MFSLKRSYCQLMAGLLVLSLASNASAVLVALTENTTIDYYKSTHSSMSTFSGAISPTFADTDDTYFVGGSDANYTLHGAAGIFPTPSDTESLIKFDLSAIPSGATIHEAQLQLYAPGGNNATRSIGAIQHQTWEEEKATKAGPDVVSPDFGWGPDANAVWDFSTDVGTTSNMLEADEGSPGVDPYPYDKFLLQDVTTDVQNFHSGTNYGWGMRLNNWGPVTSEGTDKLRPVLFVSYSVSAIPEASPVLLMSMVSLGCMIRYKRRRADG